MISFIEKIYKAFCGLGLSCFPLLSSASYCCFLTPAESEMSVENAKKFYRMALLLPPFSASFLVKCLDSTHIEVLFVNEYAGLNKNYDPEACPFLCFESLPTASRAVAIVAAIVRHFVIVLNNSRFVDMKIQLLLCHLGLLGCRVRKSRDANAPFNILCPPHAFLTHLIDLPALPPFEDWVQNSSPSANAFAHALLDKGMVEMVFFVLFLCSRVIHRLFLFGTQIKASNADISSRVRVSNGDKSIGDFFPSIDDLV